MSPQKIRSERSARHDVSSDPHDPRPRLSFVIPVMDEETTIRPLFEQLADVARDVASSFEVVFIDDGSTDDSWCEIHRLAVAHDEVRGIRFRRNCGKARALAVGFREVTGDIVFTLDADLQDDPQDIPTFLKELDRGFDLVSGWKRVRHDPWHKVLPSRVFNWMIGKLVRIKLHDHNCGFKCYRRAVVERVHLYGEMHRMIPALAALEGFRASEVPVHHHPRVFGRSKYGVARFWRGFVDLLTVFYLAKFRERPAHLIGANALILFAASLLILAQGVVGGPSSTGAVFWAAGLAQVGAFFTLCFALFCAHWVHEALSRSWVAPVAEDTERELEGSSLRSRTPGMEPRERASTSTPTPSAT